MSTTFTASTLINRVRNFLGDYPHGSMEDVLTTSLNAGDTTVPVGDGTRYVAGDFFQIEDELLLVASVTGNSLTVRRGQRGTAATSHPANAQIYNTPQWSNVEIVDAINESFQAMFPYIFTTDVQTITTVEDQFIYDLPASWQDYPETQVVKLEWHDPSYTTVDFQPFSHWTIHHATIPQLRLHARKVDSGKTLRLTAIKSISGFSLSSTATSGTATALIPSRADHLAVLFAAGTLLGQKEASRDSYDKASTELGSNRVQPGAIQRSSQSFLADFYRRLSRRSMRPLPEQVRIT